MKIYLQCQECGFRAHYSTRDSEKAEKFDVHAWECRVCGAPIVIQYEQAFRRIANAHSNLANRH